MQPVQPNGHPHRWPRPTVPRAWLHELFAGKLGGLSHRRQRRTQAAERRCNVHVFHAACTASTPQRAAGWERPGQVGGACSDRAHHPCAVPDGEPAVANAAVVGAAPRRGWCTAAAHAMPEHARRAHLRKARPARQVERPAEHAVTLKIQHCLRGQAGPEVVAHKEHLRQHTVPFTAQPRLEWAALVVGLASEGKCILWDGPQIEPTERE
eukprot:scaffold33917_cov71-Phaeocystis_antarctica.AAC.3